MKQLMKCSCCKPKQRQRVVWLLRYFLQTLLVSWEAASTCLHCGGWGGCWGLCLWSDTMLVPHTAPLSHSTQECSPQATMFLRLIKIESFSNNVQFCWTTGFHFYDFVCKLFEPMNHFFHRQTAAFLMPMGACRHRLLELHCCTHFQHIWCNCITQRAHEGQKKTFCFSIYTFVLPALQVRPSGPGPSREQRPGLGVGLLRQQHRQHPWSPATQNPAAQQNPSPPGTTSKPSLGFSFPAINLRYLPNLVEQNVSSLPTLLLGHLPVSRVTSFPGSQRRSGEEVWPAVRPGRRHLRCSARPGFHFRQLCQLCTFSEPVR